MSELATLPRNGLTVVSTFSGCGGSCLGFEMAGYTVLWANEFVPAAQETYRLNHPKTIVNTQDIRTIQPDAILAAIGKSVGEVDVLEGSPPCASFSTAGKRHKTWNKVKAYSDTAQRSDDLFFEFARLVKGLQPKTFVAENVSGLVKGVAKGYFKEILAALKACGYVVEARLLDAQWLGVPQMRQRIIFVGVRADLCVAYGVRPAFPTPLPYRYSVRDALPWISKQGDNGGFGSGSMREAVHPSPTIGTGTQAGNGRFPPSVVEAEIIGIEDANGYTKHEFYPPDRPMDTVQAHRPRSVVIGRAYRDKRGAFGNDGDCTDTPAPTVLSDSVGTHWIDVVHDESGIWNQGSIAARPAPTVRAGRAATLHVQETPVQRRKFTIAELKRICAFPDDFQLTGTYAQQWERLGRAVPPLMMRAVAEVLRDQIFVKLPRSEGL